MADDLRGRIARAIEEVGSAVPVFDDFLWGSSAATHSRSVRAAYADAARIARETPDAAAELAARVADLEARLRELEVTDDGR